MNYYITPDDYEKAASKGISRRTLETRVRNYGWSIKRAISEPVLSKHSLISKYSKLAEANGISRNTFNQRLYKLMWSPEKASTTPISKKYQTKKNKLK